MYNMEEQEQEMAYPEAVKQALEDTDNLKFIKPLTVEEKKQSKW